MTRPSPSNDSGHARRVIVTLVITTAAAAVTAGVALQRHPHPEAVVRAAEASSKSAPASIDASADATSSSDPSLPAAAEALQRAVDTSEAALTF